MHSHRFSQDGNQLQSQYVQYMYIKPSSSHPGMLQPFDWNQLGLIMPYALCLCAPIAMYTVAAVEPLSTRHNRTKPVLLGGVLLSLNIYMSGLGNNRIENRYRIYFNPVKTSVLSLSVINPWWLPLCVDHVVCKEHTGDAVKKRSDSLPVAFWEPFCSKSVSCTNFCQLCPHAVTLQTNLCA